MLGFYCDQSQSHYLLTSMGNHCTAEYLKNEAISQGFYESGYAFAGSPSMTFCEKLNSPFLFSQPNLVLPKVILNSNLNKIDKKINVKMICHTFFLFFLKTGGN